VPVESGTSTRLTDSAFTVVSPDGQVQCKSAITARNLAENEGGYIFIGGVPVNPETFKMLHDIEVMLVRLRTAVWHTKTELGVSPAAIAAFIEGLTLPPLFTEEEIIQLEEVWVEPTEE
jgi:hypothetical protein